MLALLLVCIPLLSIAARPARNAYLNHRVRSVSGLIAQVRHDRHVADRYMRHFGMTRHQVIVKLSKLHVARLGRNMHVKMYSVPRGGYIKAHNTKLRKGELVFEDAKGRVVLILKCGNPVVRGKLHAAFFMPPMLDLSIPPLPELPAVKGPLASNGPIFEFLQPATKPDVATAPGLPLPVPNVVLPSIATVTNSTPDVTTVAASNPHLAGLLVAVPLLALAGSTFQPHGSPPIVPPPTPEPMSMLLLAAGAGGILLRRRSSAQG